MQARPRLEALPGCKRQASENAVARWWRRSRFSVSSLVAGLLGGRDAHLHTCAQDSLCCASLLCLCRTGCAVVEQEAKTALPAQALSCKHGHLYSLLVTVTSVDVASVLATEMRPNARMPLHACAHQNNKTGNLHLHQANYHLLIQGRASTCTERSLAKPSLP